MISISTIEIVGQIIGIGGMILAFMSFQQNESHKIQLFHTLAGCFFMLHFILLGAPEGAVMNLIGAGRSFVFYQSSCHKKWANSRIWLYSFIAIFLLAGFITWKGYLSLFPTIAMVLSTIALYSKKPKINRLVFLPSSPLWLTYDILSMSIAGTITEIFNLISITIAIIRFDILKQKTA